MKTQKVIKKAQLAQLFDKIKQSGKTIVAPRKKGDKYYFAKINQFSDIDFDYIQTAVSAKSYAFPRCEELFKYTFSEGKTQLEDIQPHDGEIVLFGVRACDAYAFEYMSAFFLKENPDAHFQKRKDSLTLITLGCSKSDEHCFCTSVGISPGDTRGSDIVMTDMQNGDFYTEVITEKGEALIKANADLFTDSAVQNKEPYLVKLQPRFNADSVYKKIDSFFDSPVWLDQSLSCLSCGACAFVCPTCSCFDIQDEGNVNGGARLRCWDTCALGLFTKHASGHNPRHVQSERWRQRMKHKFEYTKETLDMISCTGCGRCARVCPAQMNIVEHILSIEEK